ncbi:cation-transporting P-type ATPase [Legionella drancourtii]|uniref:Cation-transporting P-type ATPase N-terminal domain-containing protein n=1 Tax=Legionella drancourtii LLAP12 TaxID=658187 RepID=G9EP74_9GAMM|nr:cation-transporting P-type ATPase [Legionella drancourtii]EHL30909.1 hypothetical protein LDG_7056 [Legionella drancourtii LLAP12]
MKFSIGHPKDSQSPPGSKIDTQDDLQSLPLSEVERQLETSKDGLSHDEAQKRLAQYGPNQIEEKEENLILKFLSYFWGPIPWMIEIAVLLSGVVRHWPDFFHHSHFAYFQRFGWLLGRARGR